MESNKLEDRPQLKTELAELLKNSEVLSISAPIPTVTSVRVKNTSVEGSQFPYFLIKSYELPENASQKSSLLQNLQGCFTTLSKLSHPQFPRALKCLFSENTCEMLYEDPGDLISKPEFAEICKAFSEQLLEGFYYLETEGYSCIGATLEDIRFSSGQFRFSETIVEKIVPKWLPPNFYSALENINANYAGPELAFYASGCSAADFSTKPCITEETPILNLSHQDVFCWASLVYRFITGEFCDLSAKKSFESYSAFLDSVAKLQVPNDKDENVGKALRAILRLAFSFDPTTRPSFYTLRKLYKKAGGASRWCKICGKLQKDVIEPLKCTSCNDIKRLLDQNYTSDTFAEKVVRRFQENPYCALNVLAEISDLKFNSDHTAIILKLIANFLPDHESYHIIYALKETIQNCVKLREYALVYEYVSNLLEYEIELPDSEQKFTTHLNSHLILLLFPIGFKPLPDPVTIQRTTSKITVDTYRNFLYNSVELLLTKSNENSILLRAELAIYKCWNEYFLEMYNESKNSIKNVSKLLKDYFKEVRTSLQTFTLLSLYEKLLRLSVETSIIDVAYDCLKNIPLLIEKHYSKKDCEEFLAIYKGYLHLMENDKIDGKIQLERYFSVIPREGNIVNSLIANYLMGTIFYNDGNTQEAIKYFIKAATVPITDPGPLKEICIDALGNLTHSLIKAKSYTEAYEYAKKAVQEYRKKQNKEQLAKMLLYYSVAQRAKKSPAEAKSSLDAAVKLVEEEDEYNKDWLTCSSIHFELGNYAYRNKDFKQAKKYYARAMEIYNNNWGDTKDYSLKTKIATNYANVLREMGKVQEAKDEYKDVLQEIAIRFGGSCAEAVKPLVNLGTLYAEIGKVEKAKSYIRKALKVLGKKGKESSVLYRRVVSISRKLEQIPTENEEEKNPPLALKPQPMFIMPSIPLTEEEQVVKELIWQIRENNPIRPVQVCFLALTEFFQDVLSSADHSGTIDKVSDTYITRISPIEDVQVLLSCMGYIEDTDRYVVTNGNPKIFSTALYYIK